MCIDRGCELAASFGRLTCQRPLESASASVVVPAKRTVKFKIGRLMKQRLFDEDSENRAAKRAIRTLLAAQVAGLTRQRRQQFTGRDAERVRRTIEEQASSYEQPQEVIDWYYNSREHLSAVESVVMEDQVVDWVVGQAQVEDEKMSFESLMEAAS